MSQPRSAERRRRWASVDRRRATRLRDVERQLVARLDELYQSDRRGYDAIMAVLRRVVARQAERGR